MQDKNNYRPISVLPIFSKIMERLIHDRLYGYLDQCQVLSSSQSGFRKSHSTTTCLSDFLNAVYNNIEEGRLSGVAFLDLKKAFDTVDHRILLSKLSDLNISYRSIRWFDSYLSERTQVTKVGKCESDSGSLSCGVPQGSIMGPLLFITYINSLPEALDGFMTFLYADDTAILTTANNIDQISSNLDNALHLSADWMKSIKLSLNVAKTKCMLIGTSQRLNNAVIPDVKCNGSTIERVDSFKYLGVYLDKNLKFNVHADYVRRKIFSKMKALAKTRQFVSQSMSLQLYRSLVLPHLDYGDILYDTMSAQDSNKLQVIQNKCLRICLKEDPRASVDRLHDVAKLPTLKDHRIMHSVKFVYEGLNNKSSVKVNEMFSFVNETHDVNTRASTDKMAAMPHATLQISKGNIRFRGAGYFNELPAVARTAPTTNSFKNRVKKHFSRPIT